MFKRVELFECQGRAIPFLLDHAPFLPPKHPSSKLNISCSFFISKRFIVCYKILNDLWSMIGEKKVDIPSTEQYTKKLGKKCKLIQHYL